jgi:signal transduction histidine kinase
VSALDLLVSVSSRQRPVRRPTAWVVAVAAPVLIALGSAPFRSSFGLACVLLCALLVVIAVAVIFGAWQALAAVVIGFLAGLAVFIRPMGGLLFRPGDGIALAAFLLVGAVVVAVVNQFIVLAEERGNHMALERGLRRVATVVARGAEPKEVFAAVAKEVGQLLSVDFAYMGRYEPEDSVTITAAWAKSGGQVAVGSRFKLGGRNLGTIVYRTGRTTRFDSLAGASGLPAIAARETGFRASVGTPIIVDGRRWGIMAVGSSVERGLQEDTELRLVQFTELLAAAVANAESRTWLARLANEQTALRRVATLVARGAPPEQVFAAVAKEIGELLEVASVGVGRFETDGTVTSVAVWGSGLAQFPVGSEWVREGKNLVTIVSETGRPARIDSYADASGPVGTTVRETGLRSAVGTPIIVEGHLWGVVIAACTAEEPLPADSEARLASFTELVATAIANTESRGELTASRARIVAATDDARRRIERDLHDRAQQRLVSMMLELRTIDTTDPSAMAELTVQLAHTEQGLGEVLDELREISRGVHPAVVSESGLGPALRALARRSAVPVELDLHAEHRPPEHVAVAAYYVVSEALTNAAKHAHASVVNVELEANEELVRLAIRDDGVGGADPGRGSGLVGLVDRVEALGGTLQVSSPAGAGTTLSIEIPLDARSDSGPNGASATAGTDATATATAGTDATATSNARTDATDATVSVHNRVGRPDGRAAPSIGPGIQGAQDAIMRGFPAMTPPRGKRSQ